MNAEVQVILDRVKDTADFGYVDFKNINTTNVLGDNALHCVIVWGDYEAAQILIKNGIDIQKHGEHGYTPLHTACQFGRMDIVELLLRHGADATARTEGDLPFTVARLNSHDDICDFLNSRPNQESISSLEAHAAHIKHIEDLSPGIERQIRSCDSETPSGKP